MTITNFVSRVLVAHELATPPAGFAGTSSSSNSIGLGTKTFVTQSYLAYRAGQRVRWVSTASGLHYVEGEILSFADGVMVVVVDHTGLSGTYASWVVVSAGIPGLDGAPGDLISYPTRTSAIAASPTGPVIFLRTAGFAAAGDGGGALYKKVGSEPLHTFKFQSANSVWWEGCEFPVSARMFGVSEAASDNVAALDDLCAYLETVGGTGYLPRGEYLTSGAHGVHPTGSSVVSLYGDGKGASILKATGNQDLLTLTANSLCTVQGIGFDKVSRNQSGNGLVVKGTAYASLRDISAYGFETGVKGEDCLTSILEGVICRENVNGAWFERGTSSNPNAITLIGCSLSLNKRWGARFNNPATLNIEGGSIEGNGWGSTGFNGGAYIANPGGEGRTGVNIRGVHMEQNEGSADVHVANSSNPAVINVMENTFIRLRDADVTNNIFIENDGTYPIIVNYGGNSFWDAVTASASKKFIAVATHTNTTLNDLETNYYSNTTALQDFGPFGPNIVPQARTSAQVSVVNNGAASISGRVQNIASVSRGSVGIVTATFAKEMATSDYRVSLASGTPNVSVHFASKTAVNCTVQTRNLSGDLVDANFDLLVFGGHL